MKYLAITAVLCIILAGASFAGEVTITEVITSGNLTLTMPNNFSFPSYGLGGAASYEIIVGYPYYVEDSSGSGAGWNLGLQCSQFTTNGTPARTIPTDNFKMYLGNIVTVYGKANDAIYGPKSLQAEYPGTTIGSTEVKMIQSTTDYGMGKYRLNLNHNIVISAETCAGTYAATLTATLNAVP